MYEAFYGLIGRPFQLSPDPGFLYQSRVHKRAYAYLEYGLYQGEGFIIITGEVGAGKTILVRNLLAHLNPDQIVAAHLVSTQLDADDLLRAVASSFGVPIRGVDKATLLVDIAETLRRFATERKQALLIVDEAQNLTARAVEELRMLSNYQLGGKALLQSFLVGQPELRNILQGQDMQQFRQRVIASYHLTPLDREDTQSYIEHRLKQVRWQGDPTMTDGAYDAIYAFTAGIPRRINLVCNRLLLAGYLNEKHILEDSDVEAVAAELKEELGLMGQDPELELRRVSGSEVPAVLRRPVRLRATALGQPAPRVERTDDEEPVSGDGQLLLRIARLERTMSLVRRMLMRVVRVMEAGS